MGEEVPVTVVHDRGAHAAVELHECRVEPGDRPLRLPFADHRADALHHAAAQDPDGVDLMWALTIRHAAALPWVELVGGAWAEHPIAVGGDVDMADGAELT